MMGASRWPPHDVPTKGLVFQRRGDLSFRKFLRFLKDSLALCNLVPYKRPLPIDYRNFGQLRGVRHEGIKYYGGSVELADFCPYNQVQL